MPCGIASFFEEHPFCFDTEEQIRMRCHRRQIDGAGSAPCEHVLFGSLCGVKVAQY